MKNAKRPPCFLVVVSAFALFTAVHSPANGAEGARSKPVVKKNGASQTLQRHNREPGNQVLFRNKRTRMSSVDPRASLMKKNYVAPVLQHTKEKKKPTETSVRVPPQSSVVEGERRRTTQATIVLAAIAVCIALGGTLAIMVLVSKRSGQKAGGNNSRIQVEPALPLPVQTPAFVANEAVQRDEETLFDFREEEENAIDLAQRFHRGQGELNLAFNLQSRRKVHSTIEKLMHSRSIGNPNRRKKLLAKRLGIGNGEVELALKFKKLRHSQRSKSHSYYSQEVA